MHHRNHIVMTWMFMLAVNTGLTAVVQAGDDYYVLPYDVDPAVQIDADLSDWDGVPNAIVLNSADQVTFGRKTWKDVADLSAVVHIAWRAGGLFIGAQVKDDFFTQPYTGLDIYNGDHLNLFIDTTPQARLDRNDMGLGQYHLVISPGNLKEGDARTSPEIYFYIPQAMPHKNQCEVAAKRTDDGYIVEAFIPFSLLDKIKVGQGEDFNYMVAVSDADAQPAKQNAMITPTHTPWKYGRRMLIPAVLGDGNGQADPPVRTRTVTDKTLQISAGQSASIDFEMDDLPPGKVPHLFLRTRIPYKVAGGYFPNGLRLELNGKPVTGDRLSNRPAEATMLRGDINRYVTSDGAMAVWYTPSFEAVEKHPQYRLVGGIKACEYAFRVEGILKKGTNTLTLINQAHDDPGKGMKRTIIVDDLVIQLKVPIAPIQYAAAPTGQIPTITPRTDFSPAWSRLQHRDEKIRIETAKQVFDIHSRFSAPDGRWYTGSNTYYTHQRKVSKQGEWIVVRDTFTNKTDANVPIIQEHRCDLGDRLEKVYLGGVPMPSGQGTKRDGGNPSLYASTSGAGLGLIALNDIFRVHVETSAKAGGVVQIADRSFVLKPGASYTSELAIVPTASPDFWAFINRARRMMEVNYTLPINFAFMGNAESVYKWSDQQFTSFIENKSANFIVQSIYGPPKSRYKGRNAYSTAWANVSHDYYYDMNKRLRTHYPDKQVKHGIYYHCFIDNYDGNDVRFSDARITDAKGKQVNYGGRHYYNKIFLPTQNNAYGRETGKNVDIILDDIGADGIFWDEHVYSRVPYSYNQWDECSADIDPATFQITKLKASVPLLSLGWRKNLAEKIMARGWLITNGAPVTRTMANLHYQAFTETGSIMYSRKMLLHTPVALGDHRTERSEKDAYRGMLKALDHGCLYAWYHVSVVPTHPTLTEHMYPFTPIELHSGYVIGEERIITKVSGLFGWGEDSSFEAHVYDRDGRATDKIQIATVKRDGQQFAEVRLPEGYAAVIVRHIPQD